MGGAKESDRRTGEQEPNLEGSCTSCRKKADFIEGMGNHWRVLRSNKIRFTLSEEKTMTLEAGRRISRLSICPGQRGGSLR